MKNLVLLLATVFASCLARAAMTDSERNQKIDSVLFHHYSGRPLEARKEAEELRDAFPDEPFFRELIAEIIWQELAKLLSASPGEESVNFERVRNNSHAQYLTERFKEEVFAGLALTLEFLEADPNNVKNLFLRAMLKLRYAGFIAKFESGWKSYVESDRETVEALSILKRCMELDRSLCSAKYCFALAKHVLIKTADTSIFNNLAIRARSKLHDFLGSNFNQNDTLRWLEESMACSSDHWWTKDIEIDKKLIYQTILVKQAGRMDDKVLPVLEELNRRFPENKGVRENLFLVRLHIQNRSRSSR